jgi:hypothetical protein
VLAAAAGQAVLDPAVQQRLLSAAVRAPAAQPEHDPDELTLGSPRDRTQAVRYAYTHGYADPARSG